MRIPKIIAQRTIPALMAAGAGYAWQRRNPPSQESRTSQVFVNRIFDSPTPEIEQGEKGEIGVNLAGLVKTMGASMYGTSIDETAVKELLQNAFDSIKEAVHKGFIKEGDIRINFNEVDNSITVEDNGMGMTPEIVRNAFFTLGGTHKDLPPHLRSGGYGQAKIAFLLSVKEISLETTRDGVTTRTTATPEQMIAKEFTISKTPASGKTHGTRVKVRMPQVVEISRYRHYSCLESPLIGPVKVTVTSGTEEELPLGVNFQQSPCAQRTFKWGSVDIYMKPPALGYPSHSVLCSGVFQFNPHFLQAGSYSQIPYDIIVDIKPNVLPEDPNYPITNNRQAFRESIKDDIVDLRSSLQSIESYLESEITWKILQNGLCIPRSKTENAWTPLLDLKARTSKIFPTPPYQFNAQGRLDQPNALPFLQCDLKNPVFVANSTIEPADLEASKPFLTELGLIYSDMKEAVENSSLKEYPHKLKSHRIGLFCDRSFHGVNTVYPFNGIFLNPWSHSDAQTLEAVRRAMLTTMIHEIAHVKVRSHDAEHNSEMATIMKNLADQGVLKKIEGKLDLLLQNNQELYFRMRKKYAQAASLYKTSESFVD